MLQVRLDFWSRERLRFAGALLAIAGLPGESLAQASTKVTVGEQIYSDYCSNCHGVELNNSSSGATFDLRRLRPEDHDRFVQSVLNGKRQMPPWRGVLNLDQIESIWDYIRAVVDQ
jgi:mono/diheme cytochrome c family protein